MSLVKINDVKYDKELFVAWSCNSALDEVFSIAGGIPKATNWMVVGDPGVGKSTVLLDALAGCKASGARVLFVSAEMNQVDLYLYVQRYPKFGDIEIFFPQELHDECPKTAIERVIREGWDLVLFDSFIEVQEIVKEAAGMSTKGSEKWLLDLMGEQNLGGNPLGKFTSFLNIQQVTKSGEFVGSNRLKHMTTGMMEIRFVDESEDERYLMFSKNRRGHVGKRLYFDLAAEGDVAYDHERFKKAEEMHILKKQEREEIKRGESAFNNLFQLGEDTAQPDPEQTV